MAVSSFIVGCGVSAGVATQPHLIDRKPAVYGFEVGYRGYVLNSQGPFGSIATTLYPKREHSFGLESRSRLQGGYGVLPLPHESRFGVEVAGGTVLGNVEVGENGRYALGPSMELSFPLRLTRSLDTWQEPGLLRLVLLAPKIGFEMLFPTGDVQHNPVTVLDLSITVRFVEWPAVLP